MTTAIEGAELTQVGPGTAMGQLMRQYWLPALMSSELERDGAPMQVVLPYFRARKVAVMTLRSEADLQASKAQAGRQ